MVGDITATIHISTKYFCRARKDMSFLGSTFVVLFDYLLCFGIQYGPIYVETMHIEVLLYYKCIAYAVLVVRHRSLVAYKRVLFIPLKVYQDNNIGLKIFRIKFLDSSIRSYVHTHPFRIGGDVYGFMMFYLRPIKAFFLDCIESIITSQISAKQIAV